MMGHARLWKPVLPFLMDEGAARAFGGLRGSRRGFSDGGVFAPSARGGGHDVNRTLYKFCENTSVLISYSLKAHVSPGHASSSGRGSGENMALGLRKLFLSDPGGRLRARYEQIGFARARITDSQLNSIHFSERKTPLTLIFRLRNKRVISSWFL